MYRRIIQNDLKKNPLASTALALFIMAGALLLSLALTLGFQLFGAIDALMEEAKTPHFMQMHAGEVDEERLLSFAAGESEVESVQLARFLNLDSADFLLNGKDLSRSVQDNGLCVQGKDLDFLLGMDGKRLQAQKGELYVPLCYEAEYNLQSGERAQICGREFVIAGFLRDSQMNSSLASSKRFLVNEEDYAALCGFGEEEYLIEFRLTDISRLEELEKAYTAAGLECSGPTISYPLFRMISALSEGMLFAVIMLVSILCVLIAFACIRFTLLAKMEEDCREIGVMKGIGIPMKRIKMLYRAKYILLDGLGCALGFGLSLPLKGPLLYNIHHQMGVGKNEAVALLCSILGVILLAVLILAYSNGILRRFEGLSAVRTIRFGANQQEKNGAKKLHLSRAGFLPVNLFLGVKDVLARKKLYTALLFSLVLAAFILIVPVNLLRTVSAADFMRYMGAGLCDMRVDLQQLPELEEKTAQLGAALASDERIDDYAVLSTKMYGVYSAEGTLENLRVELGDHSLFPLSYAQGEAPRTQDEIALSVLGAQSLGNIKTGDSLVLLQNGKKRILCVCGLYSDVTNGGKTAKAAFADSSTPSMWCIINADTAPGVDKRELIEDYKQSFPFAKICDPQDYVRQTFGSTITAVKKAVIAAAATALLVTGLITLLSLRMLIAKDRYAIASLCACGFTRRDIRIQYTVRVLFVLLLGTALGALCANTIGESLAGLALSLLGAFGFRFSSGGWGLRLLCPLLMLLVALLASALGVRKAGMLQMSETIKE